MATIDVTGQGQGRFRVQVEDGGQQTVHDVHVPPPDAERYGGDTLPQRLVEESFRFLLEREPATSIMREFEISVIERYFPEYPAEIRRRLTSHA